MTSPASALRPSRTSPEGPVCVFLPGHPFSRAELHAMAQDGVLRRELQDAYVHAWQPVSERVRAAVLSRVLPGHLQLRGALGRLGAAWFYRCAPAPVPLPVLVDKTARTTTSVPPGMVLHQTGFAPRDLVTHHGVTLTSPRRTALDLALHVQGPAGDAALLALLGGSGQACTVAQLTADLTDLGKTPGRRAALGRVRKLGRGLDPRSHRLPAGGTQEATGRWPETR